MKFGPLPVPEALGGIIAHAVRHGALALRKGTVVTAEHVEALTRAGVSDIVVAMPEPDDLGEDEAARRIAGAAAGAGIRAEPPATGRANLFAGEAGLLLVDRARIDAINGIDEAITVATLEPMRAVAAGEMVATVKVIPFAVPESLAQAAASIAAGAVAIAPFRPLRVGVISTLLPGLKASVVAKTAEALDQRLEKLGLPPAIHHLQTLHEPAAVAGALAQSVAAGAEIAIVFGASAITDRRDVIPAAIMAAGGRIAHLGMPVDPGNLLLLGSLKATQVIGAPGCARSPRENGFDWVLQRLLAGLAVGRAEIQSMGVGGLLMEIYSRPQPRSAVFHAKAPPVAAVILAAGRSTRMGANKLLAPLEGKPVVRHVAEAALASRAGPVLVITGHDDAELRRALDGVAVTFVPNADYQEGMASSLKAGIAAVPASAAAALILLGDMPLVTPRLIDRLIDNYAAQPELKAVTPVAEGRRANPVLIARALFGEIEGLSGDVGARRVLEEAGEGVLEIMVDEDAVLLDVDTPEALARARALAARPKG